MSHSVFAHATAEKAAHYRAVMQAFAEAKAHFIVHLRPEDVRGRAPELSLDEVQSALASLVGWGNLQAEPDTTRVTSVEEFYRARFLYQITREGEAAEQAFATFDAELSRHGALQTVALEDIRGRLRSLLELAARPDPDPAGVALTLRDLTVVFTDLAENARAFMTGLGRAFELSQGDRDAFIAYKERLIGYLERFIGDLVTASADIAGRIEELDEPVDGERPIDRLLAIAAEREAADRAPQLDPAQAALAEPEQRAHYRREALANWQGHWLGLKSWFIGSGEQRSQAALLRARARRAIIDVLDAVQRLNERRIGRSDRSADFRTLARWFLTSPTEQDAHRLWHAAFGLSPARHLTVDAATLEAWRNPPVPASLPWSDAPTLTIHPRLRATGSLHKRGAPPKIARRDRERAWLADRLAAEARLLDAARKRLVTDDWLPLSQLGELDEHSFRLFMELLGDALTTAERPDAPFGATSRDGTLSIELVPLEPDSAARIQAPFGTLEGRDHQLRILDLEAPEHGRP